MRGCSLTYSQLSDNGSQRAYCTPFGIYRTATIHIVAHGTILKCTSRGAYDRGSALCRTTVPTALAGLVHISAALELAADPADIKVVRGLYDSRAQTILNALLSFDGLLQLVLSSEGSVEDRTKVELCELDNFQTAIDLQLHEICEHLSIRNHKSFLFHGAIYKVTRDIHTVANPGTFGTYHPSSFRMQTQSALLSCPHRKGLSFRTQGSSGWVFTRGTKARYASQERRAMAPRWLSQHLTFCYSEAEGVPGNGLVATPMSRRKERLFGVSGTGRTKNISAGLKAEVLALQTTSHARIRV